MMSLFDGGARGAARRGRGRGRPGLGLRARRRGLHRHQRPRGHHRRAAEHASAPRRSTSSSPTATACEAKIVGDDPNADVALLKIDPAGPQAHAARARPAPRDLVVGAPVAAIGSPFGEHQSLSVGVISALDRNIESLTAVPDRQRDPDRRRHQPRQLRRAAAERARARCSASTPRSSPPAAAARAWASPIPVDTVRRSLRELREDGKVDLRLPRRDLPAAVPAAGAAARPARSSTGALIVRGAGRQPGRRGRARGRRRQDRLPGPARHPVGRRRGGRRGRAQAHPHRRPGRPDQRHATRATRSSSRSCATASARTVDGQARRAPERRPPERP